MRSLPPDYLAELARQLASLSAVLGGFAVAFLGTLLNVGHGRRVVGWAVGGAAVAAAAFAVATIAAVSLVLALHPGAARVAATSVARARGTMAASFLLGIYALLAGLGLSGWARSAALGRTTTAAATLGAAVATWALLGFPGP